MNINVIFSFWSLNRHFGEAPAPTKKGRLRLRNTLPINFFYQTYWTVDWYLKVPVYGVWLGRSPSAFPC